MKKIRILGAILLVGLSLSCEDILEEDITEDRILALSPREGDLIEGNTVAFSWESLEGADEYNVQVYRSGAIVIDSLVEQSSLSLFLDSDNYSWRVKGLNFAYETAYTFPLDFNVESSSDLTDQSVFLNSPSDNFITNSTPIFFDWDSLEFATQYELSLIKVTTVGESVVYNSGPLTTPGISLDNTVLSEDANYRWELIATNTENNTQTNASERSFSIDRVLPNTPSLLTPAFEEEFEIDDNIAFTWNFGTDTGAVATQISSVYELATDASFTNVILDGSTELTSFSQPFETAGTYYWRVRGEDAAGNVGSFNLNGKFIVNE